MGREQGSRLPGDIIASMEATLQAGRERAARMHIADLKKAEAILSEASALIGVGFSEEELSVLQTQYKTLRAKEDENPALKEAIQRIMGTPKVARSEAFAVRKELKSTGSIDELIDGLKLKPGSIVQKVAEILRDSSQEDSLTLEKAKKSGIKKSELESGIKQLTERLKGKEIKIVNLNPERSRKGGSYFLSETGTIATEAKQAVQSAKRVDVDKKKKPKEPVAQQSEKRERTKGLNDPRPVEYTLPDGKQLRGKEGRLMKRLVSELGREFLANDLRKELFFGLSKAGGLSRLNATFRELKLKVKDSEFQLKSRRTGGGFKVKTYYSVVKADSVKTPIQEKLPAPAASEMVEDKKKRETFEVAGLSRAHFAIIAGTLLRYREHIEPFLKRKGVKYIDEEILNYVQSLAEGEEVYEHVIRLQGRQGTSEEAGKIIRIVRATAFESARQLTQDPEFEEKVKEIEEKNPNIYLFLVNLSEIFTEIERDYPKNSMSFIEKLFSSTGIKYSIDREGVVSVKRERAEVLPAETVTEPTVVVAPVAKHPLVVEAPIGAGIAARVSVQVEVAQAQPRETIFVSKPKEVLTAVEKRDEDIRKKLDMYLYDIFSKVEFRKLVDGKTVNRAFQCLKRRIFDLALREGFVVGRPDRNSIPEYSPSEIAALLYLVKDKKGKHMPSQLKKQIREIAAEERNKIIIELNGLMASNPGKTREQVAAEQYRRLHILPPNA